MKIMFTAIAVVFTLFGSFAQAGSNDTLVYCSEASPSQLNTILGSDMTSQDVGRQLMDTLVIRDRKSDKVMPHLAKSWEISKDEKEYTFHLVKGVQFHSNKLFKPTRDLRAEDVVFTFKRYIDKKHPYHNVSHGKYPGIHSSNLHEVIKDVIKVDDYTVKFVLNQPLAPLLFNLSGHSRGSIFSKEYADLLAKKGMKDEFDHQIIGSGPFKLKRYQRDQMIRFTAFDKYWMGPAKVKNLVFMITPDSAVRFQKLRNKECHLIFQPSPENLADIKKDPNLVLLNRTGVNINYLGMNTKKKPLDNVLVREAIAHSLNPEAYVKVIYNGYAKKAINPIPPMNMGHINKNPKYSFNPKKAKQLLKKAGFPNGFDTELWVMPVTRVYNPNGKKLAEMMQADLRKSGIRAKLVSYDWATYLDKSDKGEHHLVQLGWISSGDEPDSFLYNNLSCSSVGQGNVAFWCDKKFDQLIKTARKVSVRKKRVSMYEEALRVFRQQLPWVPIAHGDVFQARTKNLKGYILSSDGSVDFREAYLQ